LSRVGVTYVFANNQALSSIRRDMTRGQVASLSPETRKLIRELDANHTVNIEAFISGQVPEIYAKTRADLISMLKEFGAMAGSDKVNVIIHVLDEGQEESIEIATLAEERFGIRLSPCGPALEARSATTRFSWGPRSRAVGESGRAFLRLRGAGRVRIDPVDQYGGPY
jgi:hypothetical protein